MAFIVPLFVKIRSQSLIQLRSDRELVLTYRSKRSSLEISASISEAISAVNIATDARKDEKRPGEILGLVKTLNSADMTKYLPFYVGNVLVGNIETGFALELAAASLNEELEIELPQCSIPGSSVFVSDEQYEDTPGYIRLHSRLLGMDVIERSDAFEKVLMNACKNGAIEGWRSERQPVCARYGGDAVLNVERAAVPYLGVQSYGVHINGFVEKNGSIFVWIARRSLSKPTYAGRFDQFVAGGLPIELSLTENVVKECEEEAGLDSDLVRRCVHCSGVVSYRYDSRKGLSSKTLFTYDAQLPESFTPVNTDGEVEEFMLLPAAEVLERLKENSHEWKPNSALVFIHFCIRRGILNPENEPDFLHIAGNLHTVH